MELDDIDPADAGLNLGNELLWPTESSCEFDLRYARPLAQGDQVFNDDKVGVGEDRPGHGDWRSRFQPWAIYAFEENMIFEYINIV